jgi:hypothetical protein
MKKFMFLFVILFVALTVFGQAGNIQDQQACEYARKKKSAKIWLEYLDKFHNGMCRFEAESELKASGLPGGVIGSLHWSKMPVERMNWNAAVNYCQNLTEDGYKTWRLPTIDELRTLIKNCPQTEPGGSCKISKHCLAANCWNPDNCKCHGYGEILGYYSKLGDPQNKLWSSSVVQGFYEKAFLVHFEHGAIVADDKTGDNLVRCVR